MCLMHPMRPRMQVEALSEFHTMMAHDSARAFYGPGHVFAANELGELTACPSMSIGCVNSEI